MWHGVCPVLVFIVCYSSIARVVRRQSKVTAGHAAAAAADSSQNKISAAEMNVLKTMFVVTVVYTVTCHCHVSLTVCHCHVTLSSVTVVYTVTWMPICSYYLLITFQVIGVATDRLVWWLQGVHKIMFALLASKPAV